jgi:ATP-dependent RNA helicase SUPV3L1/SUV3
MSTNIADLLGQSLAKGCWKPQLRYQFIGQPPE